MHINWSCTFTTLLIRKGAAEFKACSLSLFDLIIVSGPLGMKRSFAQTVLVKRKWPLYLQPVHLLSTLSLALLERRAASVAWHSYRESSDSSALEISKLYWPMSRARITRYLGHAAGDTQQVYSLIHGETSSLMLPFVIHALVLASLWVMHAYLQVRKAWRV